MSRLAFLGLGSMGRLMAARLVAAGHEVVVWNRTSNNARRLAALGARTASDPAGACDGAELIVTMLSDTDALCEVTEGPRGASAGISPGATVAEMSTVGAAAVARLAESLRDGVALLDAPVLGSLKEAEAGRLTILVGGPEEEVRRWRPTLSVLGEVLHVGASGSGALAKLVANAGLFGVLGVLGETIALGRLVGLTDEQIFAVLDHTPLAPQAARRRQSIASDDYVVRFALALARKDADLAMKAAGNGGRGLPILQATRSWLAEAERSGRGSQDYTAVLAEMLGTTTVSPTDERDLRSLVRSTSTTRPRPWGPGCLAWELVDAPGCRIVEEVMGPETSEQWHVHDWSGQFFYVLHGVLTLRTPGSQIDVAGGSGIEIDPGTPHQVANTSRLDVRFLAVGHPSNRHDRRDLVPPADRTASSTPA